MNTIANVLLKDDEKVIIQPPVYHPFRLIPQGNKREIVYNPLHENADGSYSMDFENLAQVYDEKCKLLILSNPHNPAGIVWPRETLVRLAEFCHSHGITVISDEIHCDMALFGNKHIPFASVSEEAATCSITFGAPSKTFNIAGIVSSYSIIPNDTLREQFHSFLEAGELNAGTIFAYNCHFLTYNKRKVQIFYDIVVTSRITKGNMFKFHLKPIVSSFFQRNRSIIFSLVKTHKFHIVSRIHCH